MYTTSAISEDGKRLTAMEVACRRAEQGHKVCAINAASAYHCGGGVLTGGRHALEESWCVCSTLLTSLLKGVHLAHRESDRERAGMRKSVPGVAPRLPDDAAADRRRQSVGIALRPEVAHGFGRGNAAEHCADGESRGRKSGIADIMAASRKSVTGNAMRRVKKAFLQPHKQQYEAHLPVQGVVLSPDVEVFRKKADSGYAFMLEKSTLAGIISMAAFNRNPKIADSPEDAPKDKEEYVSKLTDKWRSAVVGAIKLDSEVLVIPDVGCGVFKNDPVITGDCLGVILHEFDGYFREVILLGKELFTQNAKRYISTKKSPTNDDGEMDRPATRRTRVTMVMRNFGSVFSRKSVGVKENRDYSRGNNRPQMLGSFGGSIGSADHGFAERPQPSGATLSPGGQAYQRPQPVDVAIV